MVMTREELQAEIDADEAAATAETDEKSVNENLEDDSTQESDEESKEADANEDAQDDEEGGEPDSEEGEKAEVEDWLKGDDHESQAEKKYSGTDIGNAKAKLKTKLTKRHESELDVLRAEIDELKTSRSKPSAEPVKLQRPKREDFYDADDPEDAFDKATTDYVIATTRADHAATAATGEAQRAQQQVEQTLRQGEDNHYDRAAELIVKSGISADKYQAADTAFKQAIEDVIPEAGDNVAAMFVGMLGEGSEKVVFNIGINQDKRDKFQSLLRSDPTGMKAGMYLATVNTELSSPAKRKTAAPKPAPNVKSDANMSTMDKQLSKAEKSGDVQLQIELRAKMRKQRAGA